MKIALSILGLALVSLLNAPAQVVTVKLSLPQDQFLPGETLPVAVQVTNNSGQTLHLGADAGWLRFSVESRDDSFVVMKNDDPPVVGAFDLGSAEVATKRVDLAPYFKLTRQGSYHLIATVRVKDWNVEIPSPAQPFDVIDGAKLWSQSFGLPIPAGATNTVPEVRKYTLEQANYLRSQLRMYVQVSDDPEIHIFKVRAIGPMVSFSQAEARVDGLSFLHVLYQSGARVYTYSVISPDGDIVRQENYDFSNSRPRLQTDDLGNTTVLGGVRRVKPDDFPVVNPPSEMPASAPAPAPVSKKP